MKEIDLALFFVSLVLSHGHVGFGSGAFWSKKSDRLVTRYFLIVLKPTQLLEIILIAN